jgi:hypothetical protein
MLSILAVITGLIGCTYLGLFHLRLQFLTGLFFFSLIGVAATFLLFKARLKWHVLLIVGLLWRLVFFWSEPRLSQDYVRFVWDGQIVISGESPYQSIPAKDTSTEGAIDNKILIEQMGELSANNPTNYPPLNQLFFGVAVFLGQSLSGSVFWMRVFILLADLGVFWLLLTRLKEYGVNVGWYWLNPLVIIEGVGNVHFEPVMVIFLGLSFLFMSQQKLVLSGIALGGSILMKLLPLLIIPILMWRWNWRRFILFVTVTFLVVGLSYVPFIELEGLRNHRDSIALWFSRFEFNASIYYLFREVGFWITGYNQIAVIGKILMVMIIVYTGVISFKLKAQNITQIAGGLLLVLAGYFLLSTTVHPWYLITLVFLAGFVQWRFIWAWSLLVFLSYVSYSHLSPLVQSIIIATEYILLAYAIFLERHQITQLWSSSQIHSNATHSH